MTILMQRELDRLKKMILALSALVEESLQRSVRALMEKDVPLAQLVMETDRKIDRTEVEVEEECLKILALHQPVAGDLRFIIAVLKIDNDLERIGDLAVNIAHKTIFLAGQPPVPLDFDFSEMARKSQAMVKKAIDALVNIDVKLAREVCASDDEIDRMKSELRGKVEEAIRENPSRVRVLTALHGVGRNLERIADQATNIAEDVIYLAEGTIVRHGGIVS